MDVRSEVRWLPGADLEERRQGPDSIEERSRHDRDLSPGGGGRAPPRCGPRRRRWRDRGGRCARPAVVPGAAASRRAQRPLDRVLRLRPAAPRGRGPDRLAVGRAAEEAARGPWGFRRAHVHRAAGLRRAGDRSRARPRPRGRHREAQEVAIWIRTERCVAQAEARSAAGVRGRRLSPWPERCGLAAGGLLQRESAAFRREGQSGIHATPSPGGVRAGHAAARSPLSIRRSPEQQAFTLGRRRHGRADVGDAMGLAETGGADQIRRMDRGRSSASRRVPRAASRQAAEGREARRRDRVDLPPAPSLQLRRSAEPWRRRKPEPRGQVARGRTRKRSQKASSVSGGFDSRGCYAFRRKGALTSRTDPLSPPRTYSPSRHHRAGRCSRCTRRRRGRYCQRSASAAVSGCPREPPFP